MARLISACALAVLACAAATGARAQGTTLAFSGLRAGAGEPVEITADQLDVSQKAATAIFKGHVLVVQGGLKLSSDSLTVEYVAGDQSKIDRLIASGNVLLSTPAEAARAEAAIYSLTTSHLDMTGHVVLTQGSNVMSGEKLSVDLKAGTGRMDGRVKTVLKPAGN